MLHRNLFTRLEHDESEHPFLKADSALCEGPRWLQSAALHRRGDSGDTRSCSLRATFQGTNLLRAIYGYTSRLVLEIPRHSFSCIRVVCIVDMINFVSLCLSFHQQ